MELWIRSQDRKTLVKVTDIDISYEDNRIILVNSYVSAKYKTKERAFEILDEIISKMENIKNIPSNITDVSKQIFVPPFMIYEMPEE